MNTISEMNVTNALKDNSESLNNELLLSQKEKEINQLKVNIQEKKQLQDEINKLNFENIELKKNLKEQNVKISKLNKDIEEYSIELTNSLEEKENLVKESLDLSIKIKELEDKFKDFDNIKAELEAAKLDLEIKNEEFEGLKLEMLNLKENSVANLDPNSAQVKIVQLERTLKSTEDALIKLNDQKQQEIYQLQKEIKEKTEKSQSF